MQVYIPKMAEELKRFVQAHGYGEWIEHVTQDFDFENLMKGLEWFANSGCLGCIQGGGMPNCKVRNYCIEKGLEKLLFLRRFSKVRKTQLSKRNLQN
jgi:hypothetical protein